jgi:hypothetical protein
MITPLFAADFKIVLNPILSMQNIGVNPVFEWRVLRASKNKIEVVLKPLLMSMLLMGMSGSRPHEALVPAGLHVPVKFSLDPSPNYPVASLTHSGETFPVKCL